MESLHEMDLGDFHKILSRHIKRTSPYRTQEKLYNYLFDWIYADDANFGGIKPAEISYWIKGQRGISADIINASLDRGVYQYTKLFNALIANPKNFDNVGDLYSDLLEDIKKSSSTIYDEDEEDYDSMGDPEFLSSIFLRVLTTNYIKNRIDITDEVKNAFNPVIDHCKKVNQGFMTPHALYAMITMEHSLMYNLFEKVYRGFGNLLRASLTEHVNAHHGTSYTGESLNDYEFTYVAKKMAYHEELDKVLQRHVIYALLSSESDTIETINKKLRGVGKDLREIINSYPWGKSSHLSL